MEILERSLTTQASAGRNHSRSEAPCDEKESCSKCTEGKCVWCGSMSSGTCHSSKGLCGPDNGYVESCPSVGANVVLRHISGLLGAMIVVAVLLNILNRIQNRRRSNKLKRSIFTLPSYVHPSKEKRAAALREARSQLGDPHLLEHGMAEEQQPSDGDEESEDGAGKAPSCTICLCPYEDDEVIKVLPCSHDFHSTCLDSWLHLKATCPLCKAPAFGTGQRANRGTSSVSTRTPGLDRESPPERWSRRRQRETSVRGRSLLGRLELGTSRGLGGDEGRAAGGDASGNAGPGACVREESTRDGNHRDVVDRMEEETVRAEEVEDGMRTVAVRVGARNGSGSGSGSDANADADADADADDDVGVVCVDALGVLGAPDARALPTRSSSVKVAESGGLRRPGSSRGVEEEKLTDDTARRGEESDLRHHVGAVGNGSSRSHVAMPHVFRPTTPRPIALESS